MVDDERTWVTVEDVVVESDDFEDIGQDHGEQGRSGRGKVGAAQCMVFSLPAAVKFADKWMSTHRKSRE